MHAHTHILRRFAANESGVALIEFAIVLPILILLFVAVVEISRYFLFREKLESAAAQMLDIVTQNTNVTSDSLDNLYQALPAMMEPYPLGNQRVIISQIARPPNQNNGECQPAASWQYPPGGSRVVDSGGKADTRDIQMTESDNLMTIEVFTNYAPIIDNQLTRTLFQSFDIYVVSYGHTRYGTFNMDPNTGQEATTPCN